MTTLVVPGRAELSISKLTVKAWRLKRQCIDDDRMAADRPALFLGPPHESHPKPFPPVVSIDPQDANVDFPPMRYAIDPGDHLV